MGERKSWRNARSEDGKVGRRESRRKGMSGSVLWEYEGRDTRNSFTRKESNSIFGAFNLDCTVNMDTNKGLSDSIILSTLMYARETLTWSEGHGVRMQAEKVSYRRGACDLNSMDGEINARVQWGFWCLITVK